ncbi:septum formation initiator family protein [Actinobacteria bacterium IMCC26103]|nr:septum formation initiator family protein [Actinobacteria bacterium IMCC26103]
MRRRRRSYSSNRRSSSRRTRGNARPLALIAIIFIFTLTLAPPIKNYFTQRAQISALKSQVATDRTALEKARAELSTWQDPNYVKSQARERLHFVMPGERQYIVTGSEITQAEPQTTQVAKQLPEGAPWYTKLIASVTESGL